jgi:hypothetical protein
MTVFSLEFHSMMVVATMFSLLTFLVAAVAQLPPRGPDVNAQREAMRKLGFLVGQWSGEGRMLRAAGEWIDIAQTENAKYKLDGLLLVIEGLGRAKSDGRPVLQAYGIISYDDATGKYHMRAFNDGRWLETETELIDNGKGMTWRFNLGDIRTTSTMHLTDAGEWTERHEITTGKQPRREFMELTVRPVPAHSNTK